MQRHARRSRLVAAGLSVAALVGIVTGLVVTERVAAPPGPTGPAAGAPTVDPFAGGAATPASSPAVGRVAHTVTGGS